MSPHGRTHHPTRPPRTVLVAAVFTYIGAAFLLLGGLTFLLGTGEGTFFGQPVAEISLSGIPVPITDAPAIGALLIVVSLVLVALGVLTQREHAAGRPGLTIIGVVAIGWLLYAAITRDPVSPLVPTAWIALTLVLLWVGRARGARA